ncbi:MAG: O-antigen ligase family protein [Candidatus Hydrogenedentota bacterium]
MGKKKRKKQDKSNHQQKHAQGPTHSVADASAANDSHEETFAGPSIEADSASVPLWRRILGEPIALGLAAILLARPWVDGIVYPFYNLYFFAAIVLMFAGWAFYRVVLQGEPFRFPAPTLLLGGFLLVAALGLATTIQTDATYRNLLYWTGHFFVFVLAVHALRNRLSVGIVLSAFLAVAFVQSIWSLIHFQHVLPYVRWQVEQNPQLLQQHFGTTELTGELAHRLNVNRAFGSFLFPNALGAFVILGIPAATGAFVMMRRVWRTWRESAETGSGHAALAREFGTESVLDRRERDRRLRHALAAAVGVWVVVFSAMYILTAFLQGIDFEGSGWVQSMALRVGTVWVLPLALALFPLVIVRKHGFRHFVIAAVTNLLPVAVALQLVTLWLTYSRGAMLGLAAAVGVVAILLTAAHYTRWLDRLRPAAGTAALVLCVAALGLAAAGQGAQSAHAQDIPGAGEPAAAGPEGLGRTMTELASPATAALRITYWRTGWEMAKDNFWTGVGLGNFGVAYPNYQHLGAGDVQMAHNDYLQVLCETGIFGFLLFMGFWGYFAVAGFRRVLAVQNRDRRWLLGGVYAGALAFLFHAFVDFNFYNPGLATFAFVLAGSVLALGGRVKPLRIGAPAAHGALAIVLLAIAGGAAAATINVWRAESRVPAEQQLQSAQTAVNYLIEQSSQGAFEPETDSWIGLQTIAALIPQPSHLQHIGEVQIPIARGGQLQYVSFNAVDTPAREQIEQGRFRVTNPAEAREMTRQAIREHISRLERADAVYSHDPEWALMLHFFYQNLQNLAGTEEERRSATLQAERWAKRAVERSPRRAMYRRYYAKALFQRGALESGPGAVRHFEEGLKQYRIATELFPVSPEIWRFYANALEDFGRRYVEAGAEDRGNALMAQASQARERADYLAEHRSGANDGAGMEDMPS